MAPKLLVSGELFGGAAEQSDEIGVPDQAAPADFDRTEVATFDKLVQLRPGQARNSRSFQNAIGEAFETSRTAWCVQIVGIFRKFAPAYFRRANGAALGIIDVQGEPPFRGSRTSCAVVHGTS